MRFAAFALMIVLVGAAAPAAGQTGQAPGKQHADKQISIRLESEQISSESIAADSPEPQTDSSIIEHDGGQNDGRNRQ